MPGREMIAALNAEIGLEFFAHNQYLMMAHYFESRSLDNLAQFFYAQAEEEKMHGLKIVHYLNEAGVTLRIPAIEAPRYDWESPVELAETFLSQETHVTEQFYKMNKMALEQGDYITQNFLQWFITEQLEEMSTAQKMIDLFKMAGDNLLMIDMMVDRLSAGQAPAAAAE